MDSCDDKSIDFIFNFFLKSIRSQNDYKQKSFLFFLFLALGFITENYNLLKANSEVSFSLFLL